MIRDPLEILEDEDSPDDFRALAAGLLGGRTDSRAIEAFTKALAGPGPATRRAAAWALSESAANLARAASDVVLDDPRLPRSEGLAMLGRLLQVGLPALRRALVNGGDAERCQAAAIILAVPYEHALHMLEDALEDDGRLGILAASLLVGRRDDAVDRLHSSLEDPQVPIDLRLIAARSLISVTDESIVRSLADVLNNADLVITWVTESPSETAVLIDQATESGSSLLREAGENAYHLSIRLLEQPASDHITESVARLTHHDPNVRADASHQLLTSADTEDVLTPLHGVVERDFDDKTINMADVADVLGRLADPESTDALTMLARHRDWTTRLFAIQGLGRLGGSGAAEAIYDALLNDPELHVRKAAAVAIPPVAGRGDDRACQALLACVLGDITVVGDHPIDRVVRPAGRALGVLKLNAAVEPLLHGLSDSRAAVRQSAAWALGELGTPGALEAMLRVFEEDQSALVRAAAAWALGQFGQPAAVGSLIGGLEHDNERVRDNVALALGELQDRSAVPALVSVLDADSSEAVRDRAAWALGELGDGRAVDALHSRLRGDRSSAVRARCARSLARIRDERSGPLLSGRLIEETDPGVREAIVYALGELPWHDARADIEVRVLEDLAVEVRKAAAQALGRIGNERTAQLLERLAADRDQPTPLREAARRAVTRIRRRYEG